MPRWRCLVSFQPVAADLLCILDFPIGTDFATGWLKSRTWCYIAGSRLLWTRKGPRGYLKVPQVRLKCFLSWNRAHCLYLRCPRCLWVSLCNVLPLEHYHIDINFRTKWKRLPLRTRFMKRMHLILWNMYRTHQVKFQLWLLGSLRAVPVRAKVSDLLSIKEGSPKSCILILSKLAIVHTLNLNFAWTQVIKGCRKFHSHST